MRALVVILLLVGCGGDDTYLVVTVDRRAAVHDITTLEVTLSNEGSMRTDTLEVTSNDFPLTFSISAPGRTGDLGISIDGLDAMDTLQGRGFTTAPLAENTATVMLDSADFVVNALYANNQFLSNDFEAVGLQLAAINDGTWTAAFREDCSQCNILARRFDSSGKPVRAEIAAGDTQFSLSSPTQLTTTGSIPAVTSSGVTTLVVWDQFDASGSVACRSFNEKGVALPGQQTLSTDTADVVSAAPLSNGNFVVTWHSFVGTAQVIRATIARPDCTTLTGPANATTVSTTPGVGSTSVHRAHVATNGTVVMYAWVVDGEVFVRAGNNNGTYTMATDAKLILKTAAQEVRHVRIVPWQTGFAVAVRWAASSGTGPGKIEVYRVTPTGTLMGAPILLTDKSGSDFASSKAFGIAQRSDNALMAVWHQCESGPGSCDVFGRILRPTGVPVGDPYMIPTSTISDQVNPSIIALDNMSFVAAWNDSSAAEPDPSGSAVRARILYPPYDEARGVQGALCGSSATTGSSTCGEGLACAMGSDGMQRCFATCTPPSCPGGGTCSTVDAITSACVF